MSTCFGENGQNVLVRNLNFSLLYPPLRLFCLKSSIKVRPHHLQGPQVPPAQVQVLRNIHWQESECY